MSDSSPSEVETPVFTIIQSGDRLEYSVAIDRAGDRKALIPFFGNRQDAQRWIDCAGEQWFRVGSAKSQWREAA